MNISQVFQKVVYRCSKIEVKVIHNHIQSMGISEKKKIGISTTNNQHFG